MITTSIDLTTLLPWSAPERKKLKDGSLRDLRLAPIPPREEATGAAFWDLWKKKKEELKAAGLSVKPITQDLKAWEALWWAPIPEAEQRKVVEAKKEAVAASWAADAVVDLPRPEGLEYLGYQKAGISFGLSRPGTLIGDEMGLGKTIQAIGIINADPSIKSVLVICPESLRMNWEKELKKWLVRELSVAIVKPNAKELPNTDVLIIGYRTLSKFLKSVKDPNKKYAHIHTGPLADRVFDLRVLDEAHKCKNPKAQRTIHTFATQANRKVSLTGTPICNRPIEMFPIINDLAPAEFPSYFHYGKHYCNGQYDGRGWDFSGASNLSELEERLRSTVMIRRLKSDVLKDLPQKRRQMIELENNGATAIVKKEMDQWAAYQDRLQELKAAVEVAKLTDDTDSYMEAVAALRKASSAAFEEMAAIRRDTAIAMIPYAADHIGDLLESDEGKLIVFAHHHAVQDQLLALFPEIAVLHRGGLSDEMKEAAVTAFQTDPKVRVFIGSIQASGVGITLTAGNKVLFTEEDWVPGNMTQCEDRAHRIGQNENVLVQHLVFAGSLGAYMAKTCIDKQKVIDAALDAAVAINEPIIPVVDQITVTIKEIKTQQLTAKCIQLVHQGCRILAGMDMDRAAELNGVGYNKFDSHMGHLLAKMDSLNNKLALLGRKLLMKYHGQIPSIVADIKAEPITTKAETTIA